MIKIRQLDSGLFFIRDLLLSTIKVQQETKINIILLGNRLRHITGTCHRPRHS